MRRVIAGGVIALLAAALVSVPTTDRPTSSFALRAPRIDPARLALAALTPAEDDRTDTGPLGLEAEVHPFTAPVISVASFPTFDGRGRALKPAKWRIVTSTGNCCENYLATSPRNRLFDFGGDYLNFSDDDGSTWKRVEPADPLPNFGEGAVAMAPNGDVIGVAWNPYHGDRVVPFKYEAAEERWYYTTTKLHNPFFDRESLVALPGPFTVAGQTYPYISMLKGGWPAKEPFYVSLDGLNYFVPSAKFSDQITNGTVSRWLDVKPDPELDWLQPNYQVRLTPLGRGAVLSSRSNYAEGGLGPSWAIMDKGELKWSAFDIPNDSLPDGGHMLTDSKGRLHHLRNEEKRIAYRLSADGGRSWKKLNIPLPKGSEPRPDLDFRASGKLDVTVIAAHVVNGKTELSQDYVYKLTTARGRPRLAKVYLVGMGDLETGSGVTSSAPRFDFASIALFPDGRIAVSFMDKAHTRPTLAVEL